MPEMNYVQVLDHGYVKLRNIAGPQRRSDCEFDADDTDPANSARFSFDAADRAGRTREEDLKLSRYLYAHRHTTPFEMITVWLEMKMPIFVARQFVRHRTVSINEISARYVQLPQEFYIPEPENVGVKAKSNKQGRNREVENRSAKAFAKILRDHCDSAYLQYCSALENGIPNELARCFLPVNIYTKWLWKQDLHNLMHFLSLRMDAHAQYEARAYAWAIYELLTTQLPYSMELFRQQHLPRELIEREGKWYHTDEVFSSLCGPFLTKVEAQAALIRYAREALDGKTTPEIAWLRDNDDEVDT